MKRKIKRKSILWPDHIQDRETVAFAAIIIALVLTVGILIAVLFSQIMRLQRLVENLEFETYAEELQASSPESTIYDRGNRILPTLTPVITGEELPDPAIADGSFKTYLRHNLIKRKDSPQYQLQKLCYTDSQGFRRYQQYYLIALGMAYTNTIGETFEVELSSGKVIDCMIGDVKHPRDTDPSMRYIPINGNIVEFIIDDTVLDPAIISGGDISPLGFQGSVVRITRTEFEEWG